MDEIHRPLTCYEYEWKKYARKARNKLLHDFKYFTRTKKDTYTHIYSARIKSRDVNITLCLYDDADDVKTMTYEDGLFNMSLTVDDTLIYKYSTSNGRRLYRKLSKMLYNTTTHDMKPFFVSSYM